LWGGGGGGGGDSSATGRIFMKFDI